MVREQKNKRKKRRGVKKEIKNTNNKFLPIYFLFMHLYSDGSLSAPLCLRSGTSFRQQSIETYILIYGYRNGYTNILRGYKKKKKEKKEGKKGCHA